MTRRLIPLLFLFVPVPASADDCRAVDGARGSVSFEVRQAGSPFRGMFRGFGGEICFTQDRVTRIDVWLHPATVDTGLPEVDAALKETEFFAVKEFPRLAFASTSVEAREGRQLAHGALHIKGKGHNLDVPFRLQQEEGRWVVSGSLTLDRLRYGIGTGEWSDTRWLGAEVKVVFRAALR
ncbi:MAG: YceI family protein [Betaproteobacteria bacterium]|nr:YceI family protein [Betaproteobacteria bacterium]